MNRVVGETLARRRRERRTLGGLVTSPAGGYLRNFGCTWAKVVKAAEITELRFDELRQTAASRLVMAGVDL